MKLRHPNVVRSVGAYNPSSWKRILIAGIFVGLYSISIQFAATTIGEPHHWAVKEEKEKIREKALKDREAGVVYKSGERPETSQIDFESLPSDYLPNAWACLILFLTVSAHFLYHMMCHWSLTFKAITSFEEATHVAEGTHILVLPHRNKGQGEITKVVECEASLQLFFTFQNQKYEVLMDDAAIATKNDPNLVGEGDYACRLVDYPVSLRKTEYKEARGILTSDQLEKSYASFGSNIFDLPRPTFIQLFKKQLVSPIVIFQLFCSVLWMVDTYWKYTMFTLASILGFEASTAMQRLKSMNSLRTMGGKTYDVYVYRKEKWQRMCITELQPGDICSLSLTSSEANAMNASQLTVPADCVLLRGLAVANEANITGESVPQMKDGLGIVNSAEERLDMDKDKIHILYSGSSLIQTTGQEPNAGDGGNSSAGSIPSPPDNGVICYVLRTGFSSSQGSLMRMVEFSQENVAGDAKETCMQLLFLFCFALMAAGYSLHRGLADPTRPTYKVLLRCVQIITSVVPPSLPMQMAFAVHTALMALLKQGIYCTEPFRVPEAGKISYVFFDKTGTLTSDQMMGVNVVNPTSKKEEKMEDASLIVQAVLGSCQAMIEVNNQMCGDPIEVAALKGINWSYLPGTNLAHPGAAVRIKRQLAAQKDSAEKAVKLNDQSRKAELDKQILDTTQRLNEAEALSKKIQVKIAQRHHFVSELARMSTVCDVKSTDKAVSSGCYVFVKGSPEAIGQLLKNKPDWYDEAYQAMAEHGKRVLALAFRRAGESSEVAKYSSLPRGETEKNLEFAGFAAFKCETRNDTRLVIKSLREADHTSIMLTGDAPLTALSVGLEVGICEFSETQALILDEHLEWKPALSRSSVSPCKFSLDTCEALSKKHDLIVPGKALDVLREKFSNEIHKDVTELDQVLHYVHLWVRMSPEQKEMIIVGIKHASTMLDRGRETGHAAGTMMCGDGGNDVGALKAADIGLALLSGFGNSNVQKNEPEALASIKEELGAEDALAKVKEEEKKRIGMLSKQSGEEFKRKRTEIMANQKQWLDEEMQKRAEAGLDTGVMGSMAAMKTVMSRVKTELSVEKDKISKNHSNAFAAGAAKWAEGLDSLEDTLTVRLGDASTAAPFTSRTPSVSSVIDIIRQGRCTLLSAVQQMQIMMLESMISAYTLSAMSAEGCRPSETQMMASGSLMSVATIAFTFARPVERMHPVRPLRSVFHPAHFFSLIGQMLIHLGCMVYIAQWAKSMMTAEELQEVIDFEKSRNERISKMDETAFEDMWWFLSVPFKPNLLNTVCWLIESSQQIAVLMVNYKGHPWMKGILSNQPLFIALFASIALVAVAAWGVYPFLNDTLNLVVVPHELRMPLMVSLILSLLGSFIWDRLMIYIFAPHIFAVMREETLKTRLNDFFPLFQTVGMVLGGLLLLGLGNPLVWGICFMMYRDYKKKKQAAEEMGTMASATVAGGSASAGTSAAPKQRAGS